LQEQEILMIKRFILIVFGVLMLSYAVPHTAWADEPKLVATYSKWSVYVFTENGKKVCYMLAQPETPEGKYTRRGKIYALITNRTADGSKNVFNYIAGYPYKPGSDATIKIDDQSFTLFTQDDTAWAPDATTDEKITQAMGKGKTMIVKGTSARGTSTTDTYSLAGSGAAHQAMGKECGSK
jgi:hypothetical protein